MWSRVSRVCIVIVALSCAPSLAQDPSKNPTKLGEFLSKKGTLVVKQFHELGSLMGTSLQGLGSGFRVEAVKLYLPGRESEGLRGLKITVTRILNPEGEDSAFLDLEELQSLLEAVQYMENAIEEWAPEQDDYSEVLFTTKDDFSIGFVVTTDNTGKRTIRCFASAGSINPTTAVFEPADLAAVNDLMVAGLKYFGES